MYLAETETNEIKKIVQIRVYLTGKDQAAAQPWQQSINSKQKDDSGHEIIQLPQHPFCYDSIF